ncbi:BAX inhibitor (BI)-1/YccA family protein [Vagococcus humatus]|uniref:BAX inhibitor (BI)-1/YccA family protein n=1 Tax=Vagococcus humatus TaxID=1889241 RepID=A0A3R9ZXX8_9ENTE|nr:Bax inhibitor-1/YccA family protein [Vagococcus humatus]RST90244.1 BAX inhibitor (BI)-1/YccA family protein [Vagococcus humatus]
MNQVNNQTIDRGLQSFFSRVYAILAGGIALSAVTAFMITNVFKVEFMTIMGRTPLLFWILWIAELALVIRLGKQAMSNQPSKALGGFLAYSVLNGVTMSVTLMMYTSGTVTTAFIAAASTFGAMALFGTRTKKDLTAMGHAFRSAVWGIIIVILLNAFILHSQPVDLFISLVTVVIFSGLTAYDHQMIRRYYAQADSSSVQGLAVFCALQLYLDFINLFISFLRILGIKE